MKSSFLKHSNVWRENPTFFESLPSPLQILTRTPKSWALIILFYCVYYTCLAAFWYGMLQLFFLTLRFDEPKYKLEAREENEEQFRAA
jgi:hypothetical protein